MKKMSTQTIIDFAIQYYNGNSNTRFCIEQADKMISIDDSAARMWALKSLRYSIGINNSIYKSILLASK